MSLSIYLLNPPFKERFVRCGRWQGVAARGGTLYYPIWLSYSTGILEQGAHNTRLVDAVARRWTEADVISDALDFKPDMVVVDSNFSSLENDIKTSCRLKEATGAFTVLVGPPASQFSELALEAGMDAVARFEHELTLRELARAINARTTLADVDGISYRTEDGIVNNIARAYSTDDDLDSLPFVSSVYRKHLKVHDYFLNHAYYPMVQIITSRGCPNHCTFCSWPVTFTGRRYRGRSVGNIVDELEYIQKEMPEIKEVFIEDDSFTLDKRRVWAFCQAILERGLKVRWSCQSRATLDFKLMQAMKKAGCRLLDVGYESGSDEMLKRMRKGINTHQLVTFTKEAKRAKLKILGDFVIGLHGETKEMAQQTIDLIKIVKPDLLQIAIATPIPGTEFYEWCRTHGYLLSEDLADSIDKRGFQRCLVSYPWFKSEEIEDMVNSSILDYYLNPRYAFIALKGLMCKDFKEELMVLIRSAKAFMAISRNPDEGEHELRSNGCEKNTETLPKDHDGTLALIQSHD